MKVIRCIRWSRSAIAFAGTLVSATCLFAQWSLTVNVPNPYPSPIIADWEHNPGIVSIIVNYAGPQPATAKLVSRLETDEHGNLASGTSAEIGFSAPFPRIVQRDNRDFWSYRDLSYNAQYKEQVIRTGQLMEGSYTLYVKLVDAGTGNQLGAEQSARFYILGFSVPELILPGDSAIVTIPNPLMQWSAATQHPGFLVNYNVRIWEIGPGQTRLTAPSFPPWYTASVVNVTNLVYPGAPRPLAVGTSYVWQVQALDRNGIPLGENQGKSPLFLFTYQPGGGVVLDQFVLDSLRLVSGVAVIKQISAPPQDLGGGRYLLNGTATMRLITLDNTLVAACNVRNLVITADVGNPFISAIDSGTVERSGSPVFSYKNGFLQATRVQFSKRSGVMADSVEIDADLSIPAISLTLTALQDLKVRSSGIKGSANREFTKWGTTFSVHDHSSYRAISIGETSDTAWVSFAGDLKMMVDGSQNTLGQFHDVKITQFGRASGTCTFSSVRLAPGLDCVRLTGCSFTSGASNNLRYSGTVGDLPSPLDRVVRQPVDCHFVLKPDGDTAGGAVVFAEGSLVGPDSTRYEIPDVGIDLNLTYMGLDLRFSGGSLRTSYSRIVMAMNISFPFHDGNGALLPLSARRLHVGELSVEGQLLPNTGFLQIPFSTGDLQWDLRDVSWMQGKRLSIGNLVYLQLAGFGVEPAPFALAMTGDLSLNVLGTGGSANLRAPAKVLITGAVELPSQVSGSFVVNNVIHFDASSLRWSEGDTTIAFAKEKRIDEPNGQVRFETQQVQVTCERFLQIQGTRMDVKSGANAAPAAGGFEQVLVYQPQGENTKRVTFFGTSLSVKNTNLDSTVLDYANPTQDLSFAGKYGIPGISNYQFIVVGRIGERNGEPSIGLFAAVEGINMHLAFGVFLEDVGGGFFYNPYHSDIQTVKKLCGFDQLGTYAMGKFDELTPEPSSNVDFALLLYGGVSVLRPQLVHGKALLTITDRYFELDATVAVLGGVVNGDAHLFVGWSPSYVEGSVSVAADICGLVEAGGSVGFYVYSKDGQSDDVAWGVMGSVRADVIDIAYVTAGFFAGNPGFMMDVSFGAEVDLYIVSGSLDFEGMVWCRSDGRSYGAYAGLWAEADILGGLVGVAFGLEGALLNWSNGHVIYAVGTVEVEVVWIEVFDGSIWVAIGTNGFDAGTGRNSRYDRMIEEARHLADELKAEREEAKQELADAKSMLYTLSREQRRRMGAALLNANSAKLLTLRMLYASEKQRWASSVGFPANLQKILDTILDAQAGRVARMRDTLEERRKSDSVFLRSSLAAYSERVKTRLNLFGDVLVEDLPTVEEFGAGGTPFLGMDSVSLTIAGPDTTIIVRVPDPDSSGVIDYGKAEGQASSATRVASDDTLYRKKLLEIAAKLDGKLTILDSLLRYNRPGEKNNMMALCSLYTKGFEQMRDRYWYNAGLLDSCLGMAGRKGRAYQNSFVNEDDLRQGLLGHAQNMSKATLNEFAAARKVLLQALDSTWTDSMPPDPNDLSLLRTCFANWGTEMWHCIPYTGYTDYCWNNLFYSDSLGRQWDGRSDDFVRVWVQTTAAQSQLYERKARLYELLYDLYDQVEREAAPGAVVGDSMEIPARARLANRIPTVSIMTPWRTPGEKTRELAKLLKPPHITGFSGQFVYDQDCPSGWRRLNLSWNATHLKGVADYSLRIVKPAELFYPGYVPPIWSTGRQNSIWVPVSRPGYATGQHSILLRARSPGGYAIARKGTVNFDLSTGPRHNYSNSMSTVDPTPPSRPFVRMDTFVASTGQFYAKWGASDPESGVEDYLYAVFALNPVQCVLPRLAVGGRTEANIRGLELEHGRLHALRVWAVNGVRDTSQYGERVFMVDTTPPVPASLTRCYNAISAGVPYFHLEWQPAQDTESRVQWSILSVGSSPFGSNLADTARRPGTANWANLCTSRGLRAGETCYVTVQSLNHAGLASPETASFLVRFTDATPPASFGVTFNGYGHGYAFMVFNRTNSSDLQSGIYKYRYRFEAVQGNPLTDWTDWPQTTNAKINTDHSPQSPFLPNQRCVFAVEAVNGAGLTTRTETSFIYK